MIEEILEKYSVEVINGLNEDNVRKVVGFLKKEDCDYIDDLFEDYLDLFVIEYQEFVEKYNNLNKKYNNELLKLASEDMNILEEFFD